MGVVDKGINVTIKNKLDNLNQDYIDQEVKVVRDTFLVLSGLDAGLAILKSSQAGFTFIIQLKTQFGNIIEPLHRMVTKAWMVSFASLCSLGIIKFCYKLVDKLGSFFLTLLVGFYFCLLF